MDGFAVSRRHFLVSGLAASACRPGSARSPSLISSDVEQNREAHIEGPADLLITAGTILTQDPAQPEVDAAAIAGGVVIALGEAAKAKHLRGKHTQVLDLRGGLAVPGLTDAHAHLVGLGQTLAEIDLRGTKSVAEVLHRLDQHAPSSGWIVGRGWDQNLWPGAAMPTHGPLSAAFPDRPVWLRRVDGHAGWGNRALLEAASIHRRTQAPVGGEILRDGDGDPTGVLVDAAMSLIPAPEVSAHDLERFILAGQDHAVRRGLVGVHEMGIEGHADAAYRALADRPGAARLGLRITAYASEDWFDDGLHERVPDAVTPAARYVLAGVKLYADGALGSRGAALLAPYADRPDHHGLMQHDPEDLLRQVEQALRGGWQVATHAIGDGANRAVLDAYAAALERTPIADPRLRIEHCQIVAPADITRFARLGVIASMQPTHATSDMQWVPDRLGPERLGGAYAWRKFVAAGVHLCFGSDFPVELVDVTHGLHAAITRQDGDGKPEHGWLPDECLDLREALRGFSSEAAYAVHRERHLGRLGVGYRGDVTCFRDNLLELSPAQVRTAAILGTVVDGEVLYWAT